LVLQPRKEVELSVEDCRGHIAQIAGIVKRPHVVVSRIQLAKAGARFGDSRAVARSPNVLDAIGGVDEQRAITLVHDALVLSIYSRSYQYLHI
jgi:hypothetical protein